MEIASQAAGRVPFTQLVDLANANVGGKVLYANDDFFAPKENLIKSEAPVFIPGKYTEFGKWMDGWESRRKRVPGHDHCIVQLGLPGEIAGVTIDTSFFTGNYPEYASIDALTCDTDLTHDQMRNGPWTTILEKQPLQGNALNYFAIAHPGRFTHLRLNAYPDGGIARLRVHGRVKPAAKTLQGVIDVASVMNGAHVVTASDVHYGPMDNLILPGRAAVMGEGWETRRRRGPGFDWIIISLAGMARLQKIEVDTNHFKGNFPDRCSIEAVSLRGAVQACDFRDRTDIAWTEILPQTKLKAHTQHYFQDELLHRDQEFNFIRLNIFPDGGISRFRAWGELV